MGSEKFCLRWNDFETNISSAFRELRDDKDFFDVTLACDDEQIQAHKVILSACSPFFRNVLRRNPHQHPLLYLKGVKYTDLQSVLNFMYHGEVNVAQEELNSFLAVAEDLRVKGLTQNQSGSSSRTKETYATPKAQEIPKARPPEREPAPPPKRSRPTPSYTQEDDDIQEVVPVKTEPREHIPAPAPVEMYHAPSPIIQQVAPPPPQPSHIATPVQQTQQLQQMDDSLQYAGDESYDDYGQYGAEGGYEGGIVDTGMGGQDASKGPGQTFTEPEELFQFVCKDGLKIPGQPNFKCSICHKRFISRIAVRNHVESIHFPGMFKYSCQFCGKDMTSKSSLNYHVTMTHNKGDFR